MPVRWKWNGKTVELVNEEPSTYAGLQGAMPVDEPQNLSDPESYVRRPSSDEAINAPREAKRDWRKQQDQYWKGMKQDNLQNPFDAAAGMQQMLDSGALIEEEDGGLRNPLSRHESSTRREAMVRAHDAYTDFMHEQGNTQYDPSMGWFNPDVGAPTIRDHDGRLIVKDPSSGSWKPAFQEGETDSRVMKDEPTVSAPELKSGIRDQIALAKRLGFREG